MISLNGEFSARPPEVHRGEFVRYLPFKRSLLGSLLLGGFFVAFCIPLFSANDLTGGADGSLFSLVSSLFISFWMLGWSVGVALLGLLFLGTLFGGETVYLTPGKLVIRKQLFGVGFAVSYRGEKILNLHRIEPERESAASWRGPYLCFDYEGEVVNFGSNIDRRQAELLSQDIEETVMTQASEADDSADDEAEELTALNNPSQPIGQPLTIGSVSALALIIANSIPILYVLFADWKVGEVMLLFWAESAVIGIYNVLKMLVIDKFGTIFFGPFFVGHFGGFMIAHLLFIYALFIKDPDSGASIPLDDVIGDFVTLLPTLLALFISHGISFWRNFMAGREYLGKHPGQQMVEPYKRIIVMHVTIIIGGFLTMIFSEPLPALLLMIAMKTVADLRAHLAQHKGPAQDAG